MIPENNRFKVGGANEEIGDLPVEAEGRWTHQVKQEEDS